MGFWNKLFGGEKAETAQPKSPEAMFTDWCLDEIRKHPLVEHAQAVEGAGMPVAVKLRGGGEQTTFLRNTFEETRDQSPEDRLAALRRLLGAYDDRQRAELDWEEATALLVPVLRPSTFGVTVGASTMGILRTPFAPFLSLFIGIDEGDRIGFLTASQLERWEQSADHALAHAFLNLQHHVDVASEQVPDAELYDAQAPYPIWHVVRNDSYESSRLTLPGYLESFRSKVLGNPIAIVPQRGILVISGDGDPRAVARLAQMAEAEFRASPRSISTAIYTAGEGGQVVPLHLPAQHPRHALVERGHYLLALDIYSEQKAELEQRFEREGVDVFVATYKLLGNDETGTLWSMGTMTEDVPTLLPATDKLALVSQSGQKPFVVPYAAVLELAPECFEAAPEFEPPRLRTIGWPSPEKLAQLERLAASS